MEYKTLPATFVVVNGRDDYNQKGVNEERTKRYNSMLAEFQAAKLRGMTHKIWVTSSEANVRAAHIEADGKVVRINDPFIVGAERLFLPSDPTGSLANTANCRCTVEFVQGEVGGIPVLAYGEGSNTIIRYQNDTEEIRAGGTRTWRNHNPGAMRNYPFSERLGSLGDSGGFAVFPDVATGDAALVALLLTPDFQARTLFAAIFAFARPVVNDTTRYQAFVESRVGVAGATLVSALTSSQFQAVLDAIRIFEGWKTGSVSWRVR